MEKGRGSSDEPAAKINRRQFFKFGAGASTGVAIAAATTALQGKSLIDPKKVYAGTVKELNELPFDIPADYKRFTNQRSIFGEAFAGVKRSQDLVTSFAARRWNGYQTNGEPGFSVLDGAAVRASFAVDYYINGENSACIANKGLFEWHPNIPDRNFGWGHPERNIHSPGVKDAGEGTMGVKRMAKFFGAGAVGIAPFDDRWLMVETAAFVKTPGGGEEFKFIPTDFGFEPKHVIVAVIPQSLDSLKCAPSFLGSSEYGKTYSDTGIIAFGLSMFIRDLGYHAIPFSADSALIVPIAIQAGLGEYSRMGIMISPDYGPNIRLCGVYTDMPLNDAKPISFGVTEFCKTCKKCAELCPPQALSYDEPTVDAPRGEMQNTGIKRWYVDPVKCFTFWVENRSCCGVCQNVCPYNKPDTWHHSLAKSLAGQPGISPLLKTMDDIFGYGQPYDQKAIADWWKI